MNSSQHYISKQNILQAPGLIFRDRHPDEPERDGRLRDPDFRIPAMDPHSHDREEGPGPDQLLQRSAGLSGWILDRDRVASAQGKLPDVRTKSG